MIYLDHASTTPVDSRVLEAMLPYFGDVFANPSSLYRDGLRARSAVESAREVVARFLGCSSSEIIFTSGGTESDNIAILGTAKNYKKGHIITSQFEHPAVLNACRELEMIGFRVTYLKPTSGGFIKASDVNAVLTSDTILVSIMYANNEIGTIQPIKQIGRAIKLFNKKNKTKIVFHSDACQATGYLEMNVAKLNVDLLTINGSKIYGPKGVGVLFVKSGVHLKPVTFGGGQEKSLRPGTENTPAIVGFAKALELINDGPAKKEAKLRDFMIDELLKVRGAELNGSRDNRLPNNVNISFDGVEGESAVLYLDRAGVACSTGSACSSKSLEPSHVLLAIGQSPERAHCSLRFTLGRKNTSIEIRQAVSKIKSVIESIRRMSATYEK